MPGLDHATAVKAKGTGREKGSERRRKLAELNLLSSESRAKAAPARRGCLLPVVGIGVALAALGIALVGTHL